MILELFIERIPKSSTKLKIAAFQERLPKETANVFNVAAWEILIFEGSK
jgi:hypothetical protein